MQLPNGDYLAKCTVIFRSRKDPDDDERLTCLFEPDQRDMERHVQIYVLDDSFYQVRAALQLYAATPAPTPQNGI